MNWKPMGATPGAEGLYDDAGVLVLSLHPEWTRDGNKSQQWVWKLPIRDVDPIRQPQNVRHGITWGHHANKETARQQGLEALKRTT